MSSTKPLLVYILCYAGRIGTPGFSFLDSALCWRGHTLLSSVALRALARAVQPRSCPSCSSNQWYPEKSAPRRSRPRRTWPRGELGPRRTRPHQPENSAPSAGELGPIQPENSAPWLENSAQQCGSLTWFDIVMCFLFFVRSCLSCDTS